MKGYESMRLVVTVASIAEWAYREDKGLGKP